MNLRTAYLAANGLVDHPTCGEIIPIPGTDDGVKVLADGRLLYVMPLLFGGGGLALWRPGSVFIDDYWRYQDRWVALDDAIAWDGNGEPENWSVHPATDRRRS